MKQRTPSKSEGVPRQTQARNSIGALARALTRAGGRGEEPSAWLEAAGFFDASMSAQMRLMARCATALSDVAPDALIDVLGASPDDRVQGVAALVPSEAMTELDPQLAALQRVAVLESTWARELAQSELHNLCIAWGVDAVLRRAGHLVHAEHEALRRVLVEALRPRGVMLAHIDELKRDPTPLWPLIEAVIDDPSDYVRKAAANLLNDVSRDNPGALLDRVAAWSAEPMGAARTFVVERGLRTLIKQRDPDALALLGYAPAEVLNAALVEHPPARLVIDALLPFAVRVRNTVAADARVVVRVDVEEPGAGSKPRRSSYHLSRAVLAPGDERVLRREVHFVDRNRQPKLDGAYLFVVTVNGAEVGRAQAEFNRG